MGRLKNEDKVKTHKSMEDVKELMENAKTKNGFNVEEIFGIVSAAETSLVETDESCHIPMNTLREIQEKLNKKEVVKDDDGNEYLKPIYDEEQKAKAMFGLLAERGVNILDFLEKVLAEEGYNGKVLFSINETMGKVSELLRDIAEMQYRKAKLDNERIHLEIMKYKADLKKREIDIKEKSVERGSGATNVIAVGSPAELLEVMRGNKQIEVDVIDDEGDEDT